VSYPARVLEGQTLKPLTGWVGPPGPVAWVHGIEGTGIGMDDAWLGRHVLFVGGIGTGKTVGMTALVESLRAQAGPEDVFVFFDTKGDYIERFFRPGDVSISAGGADAFLGGQVWNLFSELSSTPSAQLADDVSELAGQLVDHLGGENNQLWSGMARDLLAALVIAYRRTGKPYTNRDIRLMSDRLTAGKIREIIMRHPDLRGTAQYIAKDGSNTTNSVLVFWQQAIRQVFSGAFQVPGGFSVREFVRGKGGHALFLEYDVSQGSTTGPVFRTLLELALKEALSRHRAAGRVFFVLDEFALLPKLDHLEAGLNFGRSLGLRFVVGTQNVGQVRGAYGPDLASSVLSSFGSVFAFRLFDQESRGFITQRFGSNRKIVHYDGALKTRGVGEQVVDGRVVEDWHLSALGVGRAVVGLPDGPPVDFTFLPPQRSSP